VPAGGHELTKPRASRPDGLGARDTDPIESLRPRGAGEIGEERGAVAQKSRSA
jgi:hypothetical protein